jgi:hypothetical protein
MVFYLIPFWDWIPTVLAHRYYCAKEAKFEVLKSPDKWKIDNPDIAGRLKHISPPTFTRVGDYTRISLNQRLAIDQRDLVYVFLAVRRQEARLVDVKTGDVLARYVEFLAGYGSFAVGGEGAWKFWLDMGACDGGIGYRADFAKFERQVARELEGEKQ